MCQQGLAARRGRRGGTLLLASGPDLSDRALRQMLQAPESLLVAGLDGEAVAGVAVAVEHTLGARQRIARVELLYVERSHRRAGVAREMLQSIDQWSRVRGQIGVDVLALPGDRATKAFLEQMGYLARLLVMHKSLEV